MSRFLSVLAILPLVATAAAQHMDATFMWDPLPKNYRLNYTDYYGRGREWSGTFENSNRWAAHFVTYNSNMAPAAGIFGGAGLSYEHNTDGGLRFDSFSIFAVGGPFARPVPWFRIGMPLRFGIGFDGMTLPYDMFVENPPNPNNPSMNGVQSFSMCGLNYGAAVSGEFIIGRHFIIGAHGGIQGSYSSSSSYYYYYSTSNGYVTMNNWGPVAALCIGGRW